MIGLLSSMKDQPFPTKKKKSRNENESLLWHCVMGALSAQERKATYLRSLVHCFPGQVVLPAFKGSSGWTEGMKASSQWNPSLWGVKWALAVSGDCWNQWDEWEWHPRKEASHWLALGKPARWPLGGGGTEYHLGKPLSPATISK